MTPDAVQYPTSRHSPDVAKADAVLAEGKGERPTTRQLAAWLNSAECPDEPFITACERLAALLGQQVMPPLELRDGVIVTEQVAISISDLWDEFRRSIDSGRQVDWPLAPLVNAWQQRPRPVEPNRRLTGRVIPGRLAMAEQSNNPRMLFSPAAHAEYGPDGKQLVLPGFGDGTHPFPFPSPAAGPCTT